MVAEKAKKSRTAAAEAGEELEREEALLEELEDLQDELEKVNEEANKMVLEVEKKYNEMRKPVYAKRNEIISSIEDFWLTALLNHPVLGDLLSEEDQEIFKYLDSLDVNDFEDVMAGYCITFTFKPNPFFEDAKLVKNIDFSEVGALSVNGTAIKWKDGKCPVERSSNWGRGKKRPLSKQSFFSWFSETQPEDGAEVELDEVAEIIKDDLWSNPIKYFSNVDDNDDDSEEDEEDENEEDDTEHDDE